MLWASQKSLEAAEALYAEFNRRHFFEGGALNDLTLLLDAVAEVPGLDVEEGRAFLRTNAGTKEILSKIERVHDAGINGIPTLIIDGRFVLNGAAHSDEICEALRSISKPSGGKLFA